MTFDGLVGFPCIVRRRCDEHGGNSSAKEGKILSICTRLPPTRHALPCHAHQRRLTGVSRTGIILAEPEQESMVLACKRAQAAAILGTNACGSLARQSRAGKHEAYGYKAFRLLIFMRR